MKYLILLLSLSTILMTSACAERSGDKKTSWLCCDIPPQEWPERHWEGQTFQPQITHQDEILPAAMNRNRSMFAAEDLKNLEPAQFIENLKSAGIISKIYNDRKWYDFDLTGSRSYDGNQTGTNTYDVNKRGPLTVDLDYNFYTLTRADQQVITELLIQSYETDLIILKDTHTHKMVGEITPEGFTLF